MRRSHRSRNFVLGLVAAACAAGCTTNAGDVLVIRQNQVPQEGCTISPDVSDLFRPEGFIDTNAGAGYLFTPVIESRAVVPEGRDPSTRLVTLQGAEVKLELFDPSGEPVGFSDAPSEFTSRTSGSLEAEGTIGLGFEILKLQHLDEIAGLIGGGGERWQVLAEVVVFGEMTGDGVASAPFVYPVTVCTGCLVADLGDCASLPADFAPEETGGACNTLQDATAECCEADGELLCPAVSTAAE